MTVVLYLSVHIRGRLNLPCNAIHSSHVQQLLHILAVLHSQDSHAPFNHSFVGLSYLLQYWSCGALILHE